MITPNDMKLITLADLDIIHTHLVRAQCENCDYNVCNIMSWGLIYKLEYCIYKDNVFFFNPFYHYLLTPSLEGVTAEELFAIYNVFKQKYPDVMITPMPEKYATMPDITKYFSVVNDLDWNDYVYTAESLVSLSGKVLSKKKNLVSQFIRAYPDYYVQPITENDCSEITTFCNMWATSHDLKDEYLEVEMQAISIIMQHWALFPAQGVKLYANGTLCAFAVWSPQNSEMASVHFEKCDVAFKGAGQMINWVTAKNIVATGYEFINREQDMGLQGIRQAKRSYNPVKMIGFLRVN